MRLPIGQIVRRATGFDANRRIDADRLTQQQRARWRSVVADDDHAMFRKRLAWDGLSAARRATRRPDARLPTWAELLVEVSDAARGLVGDRRRPRYVRARAPQAFQDVYRPFVEVARRHVEARIDRDRIGRRVSRAACVDLEHALLRQLAYVGGPTLAHEASGDPTAFVDQLFADGLDRLLRRYSVLARLWATVCEQWITSTVELLERVCADETSLAETFFGGRSLGRVARVDAMLGDRHRHGRTVAALTFASGVKIVYKPRPLGLERAFLDFVAWCNQHGGLLALRMARILDRGHYGWVEFIAAGACRHRAQVVRYHERAGMLLAIFYLLGESDCHSENLVADGEHPVPLDLETLLRPDVEPPTPVFGRTVELWHDVARTAMLPFWARSREGAGISYEPYPEGALAGGRARRGTPPNRPTLRGEPVASEDHVDDIDRGFTAMYRFFVRHRDTLLSAAGPLAAFAAPHDIRYIARGTGIYELIQKSSLHPDLLRDGRDRAITFDALSRTRLGADRRPRTWHIPGREMAALERIDVPLFHASPVDRHLRLDGGGVVKNVFLESGLDGVYRRVRALGDPDLERQRYLLQAHFATFTARPPRRGRRRSVRWPEAAVARPSQLIEHARRLGEQLEHTALPVKDGSVGWLAPELSDLGRYQLLRLGSDYGGGPAGIAVFLAALDRATGGRRFRPLAQQALLPFRRPYRDVAENLRGVAATIYALTVAGDLLEDPSLYADARRLVDLVTPERIAADHVLDVVGGAAGLVLAALALHRRIDDPRLLELSKALGDRLLSCRLRTEAGPRAWRTADGHVGVGLLHGQSGFGLALSRLGGALGEDGRRYVTAAEEGFAYERVRYSPAHAEWFDGRPRSYRGSLCKGAAGILLARLGSLPAIDNPEVRADCDVALDACARAGMLDIDHICCGNFGRIEAETLAADVLGRPELREAATRKASALVERAAAQGGFSLLSPAREIAHPSLYVGVAGIGYTLLRLAAPHQLPTLVLWD